MAETSTVGGVISGYCAIGSVNSAIAAASVMMIDSTEAKIGRLMKKFENKADCLSRARPVRAGHGWRWPRLVRYRTILPPAAAQPAAPACSVRTSSVKLRESRMALRGEQPRPAQPVDRIEKHGRQDKAEQRDAEHAAEHGGAQGLRISAPAPRAIISGTTPRMKANEVITIGRSRSRQASSVASRARLARLPFLLGELDDQNRVLAGQADQHDEADLREDVDVHLGQVHADDARSAGTSAPPE